MRGNKKRRKEKMLIDLGFVLSLLPLWLATGYCFYSWWKSVDND